MQSVQVARKEGGRMEKETINPQLKRIYSGKINSQRWLTASAHTAPACGREPECSYGLNLPSLSQLRAIMGKGIWLSWLGWALSFFCLLFLVVVVVVGGGGWSTVEEEVDLGGEAKSLG